MVWTSTNHSRSSNICKPVFWASCCICCNLLLPPANPFQSRWQQIWTGSTINQLQHLNKAPTHTHACTHKQPTNMKRKNQFYLDTLFFSKIQKGLKGGVNPTGACVVWGGPLAKFPERIISVEKYFLFKFPSFVTLGTWSVLPSHWGKSWSLTPLSQKHDEILLLQKEPPISVRRWNNIQDSQ